MQRWMQQVLLQCVTAQTLPLGWWPPRSNEQCQREQVSALPAQQLRASFPAPAAEPRKGSRGSPVQGREEAGSGQGATLGISQHSQTIASQAPSGWDRVMGWEEGAGEKLSLQPCLPPARVAGSCAAQGLAGELQPRVTALEPTDAGFATR